MSERAASPAGARRRRAGVPRAVLLAGAAIAMAALLTGCTSPRNVLGTAASPCFRAVAVARLALHRVGRFSGVRPLRGDGLAPVLAGLQASSAHLDYKASTPLCLVAYRGRFDAARVSSALSPVPATGDLALVIVRQRDVRVVATLLFDHTPPRAVARLLPGR